MATPPMIHPNESRQQVDITGGKDLATTWENAKTMKGCSHNLTGVLRVGGKQMNTKLIIFSGIVTAFLGAGIGFVTAQLFPCPYTSQIYKDLEQKYVIIGAVAGLLIGSSQEMIRELKQERDGEEYLLRNLDEAIRARKKEGKM